MTNRRRGMTELGLFAVLCTAAALLLCAPGWAQNATENVPIDLGIANHAGACSTHASLLKQACGADRRDDYLVALADCAYVVAADEQRECRAEARAERSEKFDECDEVYEARLEICELVGEQRYVFDLDPADFDDPDDIGDSVAPNPFWPLNSGHTQVVIGDGEVTIVAVTDDVRDVGGLPCRVVVDVVLEEEEEEGEFEYSGVEVTQDWYAQYLNGDIYYCGENTYEIEDDLIDNTDGSFAHNNGTQRAGLLIPAMPVVGEGSRQELATDEAEDYARTESLATSPSAEEGGDAAIACTGGCLKTFEANPHDPGENEFKYYKPGVGFVLATKFSDGEFTGEREEVTCVGDSIDIIDDPACGIGDPDAVREAMCFWSPWYFCEDDD